MSRLPSFKPTRRDLFWIGPLLLSTLYWVGRWFWIGAGVAEIHSEGGLPIQQALYEAGAVYEATWRWVIGTVVVHGLALLFAWRRGDTQARDGLLISLLLHGIFALYTEILVLPI